MIIFDHDGTLVNTETSEFHIFSGIKELLADLSEAGFTLAVWTARSHRSTAESLKRFSIAEYFEEIYGGDDGMAKPHPMGLLKMTDGFLKPNILHIGDSVGDLDGARDFGIEVIAACWNSANQVETFKKKTSFIAYHPDDCREVIAKKFGVKI